MLGTEAKQNVLFCFGLTLEGWLTRGRAKFDRLEIERRKILTEGRFDRVTIE